MKLAVAAMLFAVGPANAFCLPPPKYLTPQPGSGEIYACPVYIGSEPGKFWFSVFVETTDNNLYGFVANDKTADWSGRIGAAVAQNWTLTQFSNAYGTDLALIGFTFAPSKTQFQSPDGPVFVVTSPIWQGF